jgi:hypothetical protein
MDTNDNLRRTADGPLETASVSRPYRDDRRQALDPRGTSVPPATFVKRISWGAILAGVVIALVIQLAFSLLGLGLGASAFNPYDDHSAGNWGMGTAIYTLLSVLVSLYLGGHVAARLAGFPHPRDGMLHGLVAFGLTTLIGFYLLTSGLGMIIGGAGSLVSSVVSTAGQGAAKAAPGLVDAAKQKLQEGGVDLSSIQGQVDQLLRQTGKQQLQPDSLQNRAAGAVTQAQNATQDSSQDIQSIVSRAFSRNGDVANAVDRDALVNVIMNRTGKSRPEAEQIVGGYQRTFQQAQAKAQQLGEQAKAQAQQAADATRKSAAKGALAAALALILGALAAALGGRSGTPRDLVEVTAPARA